MLPDALRHRLDQIAMDGTQKIPQRWLDTAIDCVRTGRRCDAIVAGLAAWIRHIEQGTAVDDPHGETLVALAQGEGRAALVGYLAGGYPAAEETVDLMLSLEKGGAFRGVGRRGARARRRARTRAPPRAQTPPPPRALARFVRGTPGAR